MSDITNYIINYCDTDEQIFKVFHREKLLQTFKDAREIVSEAKEFALRFGFMNALDEHLESIVAEMKIDYIPPEDQDVLRYIGIRDPKMELQATISKFKFQQSHRIGIFSLFPKVMPSEILEETVNLLNIAAEGRIDSLEPNLSRRTTTESNGPISKRFL